MLLMYVVATIHLALAWYSLQNVFILPGTLVESIPEYGSHLPLWGVVVTVSVMAISTNTLIASCILVFHLVLAFLTHADASRNRYGEHTRCGVGA